MLKIRYNPISYVDERFWTQYLEMKHQFQIGEYVLFEGGKFLAQSSTPFRREYFGSNTEPQYVHRVEVDDERYFKPPRVLTIPNTVYQQLEQIVKQLETDGNNYQITIQQAFTGKNVIIGDFIYRQYLVYDTLPKYEQLARTYDSIEAFYDYINEFREHEMKSIDHLGKEIICWRCKKCGEWGSGDRINVRDIEVCQNCREKVSNPFGTLFINENNIIGTIPETGKLGAIGKIRLL